MRLRGGGTGTGRGGRRVPPGWGRGRVRFPPPSYPTVVPHGKGRGRAGRAAGVPPPLRRDAGSAAQAAGACEWFAVAQEDIRVMRLCHRNERYGAAAYHCQQALEKIVKFAVAKYGLMDDPAELNHDVLRRLFKKWVDVSPPRRGWPASAIREGFELLKEIGRSSRSTSRLRGAAPGGEPTTRDYLWADSLDLPISKRVLDEFRSRISAPPESILKEFLTHYFTKKARNKILKAVRVATKEGGKEAAIQAAHYACATIVWREFQRLYKPHAGRKRLSRKEAEACLLLWVQANLDTLVKVIPHEEYGRYPGTWSGRSRAKWYSEKSDVLLELEESARAAFYELYRMIKY